MVSPTAIPTEAPGIPSSLKSDVTIESISSRPENGLLKSDTSSTCWQARAKEASSDMYTIFFKTLWLGASIPRAPLQPWPCTVDIQTLMAFRPDGIPESKLSISDSESIGFAMPTCSPWCVIVSKVPHFATPGTSTLAIGFRHHAWRSWASHRRQLFSFWSKKNTAALRSLLLRKCAEGRLNGHPSVDGAVAWRRAPKGPNGEACPSRPPSRGPGATAH